MTPTVHGHSRQMPWVVTLKSLSCRFIEKVFNKRLKALPGREIEQYNVSTGL